MLIKVFSVVSMLSKLPWGGGGGATGLLKKGGGSNMVPGLVTKQQAVEFPQVLTSSYIKFLKSLLHLTHPTCLSLGVLV